MPHLAILLLSLLAPAPQASPQSAPAGGETAVRPAQAQPAPAAPAAPRRGGELHEFQFEGQWRFEGPLRAALDERRAKELQLRFQRAAKSLSRNVVRLSIERTAPGPAPIQLYDVSAFALGPQGLVVTFGDALEQADRVVVRFVNIPGARPRRATVVGVDAENCVGLLDVGPIADVSEVKLDATTPFGASGGDRPPEAAPASPSPLAASDPASCMVVSMWGVRGAENPIALGMVDGAQRVAGMRLYRISVVRRPEASGGIVFGPDENIVAMLLAPAGFVGTPDAQLQPMLGLPAPMLQAGIARVRARTAAAANAKPAPRIATGDRPRAWIGVGASDLAEPEFLRQIDRSGAVVVEEVFEASPALAARIEPHDLLLAWNGKELHGVEDFSAALAASKPGDKIELECMRLLERRKVEVTLEAW